MFFFFIYFFFFFFSFYIFFFFFFFFSSRRRHTRSLRDWSSDVCSSDLRRGLARDRIRLAQRRQDRRSERQRRADRPTQVAVQCPLRSRRRRRPEERCERGVVEMRLQDVAEVEERELSGLRRRLFRVGKRNERADDPRGNLGPAGVEWYAAGGRRGEGIDTAAGDVRIPGR